MDRYKQIDGWMDRQKIWMDRQKIWMDRKQMGVWMDRKIIIY